MQTREGLKLGISCLKHGSAKVFLYRFLLYINSSSITFSATIHWCFVWCWFIFVNFVVLVYLQIDYALHCTEYSLLRIYFLLYVLSSLTRLNGHGNVFQDRKKIIKSLKGHIMKLALSDFGCLVSNDCIYLQLFWLLNWEYCDLLSVSPFSRQDSSLFLQMDSIYPQSSANTSLFYPVPYLHYFHCWWHKACF